MLIKLLIIFTVVPLVELSLLIELGQSIGLLNTVAVVLLTGVIGAYLARSEGFAVLKRIQDELAGGQLPGDSLIDGALVLAGALLLLTPGLITDGIGFALLLPPSRTLLRAYLKKYFQNKLDTGEVKVKYRVED